ncbi:MAG: ATP-binding protein [Pseudolabrys sp.]|nr:ATP-binding protein [Pseudolabrys sp.]
MTVLSLTAKQDHLERVAKTRDPIKALSEFVWNALDANATHVSVDLLPNKLGGIDAIQIRDDGIGIAYERAQSDFSNLGDSWKKNAPRKASQRPYHGKEGRGRLRFYSLSQKARWYSTYSNGGQPLDLTIEIDSQSLGKCDLAEPTPSKKSSFGTIVDLAPLKEPFDWLQSEAALIEFSTIFAPYLLRYPDVSISYNGTPIRPSDTIELSYDFPRKTVVCPKRTIKDLTLKVIEWKSHVENRKINLGGENGIVLGSQPANVTAPDFEYSAYAYSKFFEEIADANLLELDDLTDPDFAYLMNFIRDELGEYFRTRLAERSKGLIEELKNAGAYPYEGEPRDAVERTERQVFDIATYAVSSYSRDFKKADTSLKKMTLTLLREALRHNPDSLSTILRAVVNLPKTRQDELSGLLHKTELGNIISASSLIADRVTAIEILKAMVFNPEYRHTIKERGELDVIVRDNTWIFGERFHITMPEAGLTKIMDRVSDELGTKRRGKKIKKGDGKSGRADCFLGRSVPHQRGEATEFVVIELKRPSLKIARKEIDQLEDYVSALKAQPDFAHTDTFWNFFLITGEYDDSIKDRVTQKDRPQGLFLETGNSKVWVKTWAQVLRDCESRLTFIQERLRVDVSDEDISSRISALRSSVLKEDRK